MNIKHISPRSSRAYSLIELLVVVSVLGILLTVSTFSIRNAFGISGESTCDMESSSVILARQLLEREQRDSEWTYEDLGEFLRGGEVPELPDECYSVLGGEPEDLIRLIEASDPEVPTAPLTAPEVIDVLSGVNSVYIDFNLSSGSPSSGSSLSDISLYGASSASTPDLLYLEYTVDGGNNWTALPAGQTDPPVMIEGLSETNTYDIALRGSYSNDRLSPPSEFVEAKPLESPNSPNVTATPGNASITINQSGLVAPSSELSSVSNQQSLQSGRWDQYKNEGKIPTNLLEGEGRFKIHNIEYSLNGGQWIRRTPPSTQFPFTINGLTNGQLYTVRVRYVSPMPSGGQISTVSNIVPFTNPSKPNNPTLTAGNGFITASWTAPSSNGSNITQYQVQASLNSNFSSIAQSATPSSTSTTLSLTNGNLYYVRVRAYNAAGWSDWSDNASATPVAPAPTVSAPGAPIIYSQYLHGGFPVLYVWWTTPANGSTVIDHEVTQWRWTNWYPIIFTYSQTSYDSIWTSPTSLQLADAGRLDQVTVRSRNAIGWGPSSTLYRYW